MLGIIYEFFNIDVIIIIEINGTKYNENGMEVRGVLCKNGRSIKQLIDWIGIDTHREKAKCTLYDMRYAVQMKDR